MSRRTVQILAACVFVSAAPLSEALAASDCGFVQVSHGQAHVCGLRANGAVECWGLNVSGSATPPVGVFVQVSAGAEHTCGLHPDGSVECWGNDCCGQTSPPASVFTQIAAGGFYTCGIRDDATVACWGVNDSGQATPPTGTFTQIATGARHACGLRTDGTAACWGENNGGQTISPPGTFTQLSADIVGSSSCGVRATGNVECWGIPSYWDMPAETFTSVSIHSGMCGLRTDGTVTCWPDSFTLQSPRRDNRPPPGAFTQISGPCGLRANGSVECWEPWFPLPDFPAPGLTHISLGEWPYGGCGLDEQGATRCWGTGARAPIASGAFTQLSVGSPYNCGLRASGAIKCWTNQEQQYSDPPLTPAGEFTDLSAPCGVRTTGAIDCWGTFEPPSGLFEHVVVNDDRACAIRTDESLHCWVRSGSAAAAPPTGVFEQVAIAGWFACAIHSDGSVECWKFHAGASETLILPTIPPGVFTQISLGDDHGCGLRSDGTIECWGDDEYGQASPPAGTFTEVVAESDSTCAAATDGVTECWGKWRFARPNACVACGDGVVEFTEQCDDGNTADDDGCSSQCVPTCPALPLSGCRSASRSSLSIRDSEKDLGDSVRWKWGKGSTGLAEISSPMRNSRYLLCLYPDSGPLATDLEIPIAAGWQARGTKGFAYEDATQSFSGINKLKLLTSKTGVATWDLKARGPSVPEGLLAVSAYTVQLVDVGTGLCWESAYTSGTSGDGTFKAKY